ncbi:MAG: Nif11-like leader peptide family natural product precursor [Spirochaetes bacterium]|nr:Nif11-like leader peptide family natural product precursor [Spirochaetota bacterium]
MSKKNVEEFLIAGGSDKNIRAKYDEIEDKEIFVSMANEDGYSFTLEEFTAVLNESGDSFESFGNPRKKGIWWK